MPEALIAAITPLLPANTGVGWSDPRASYPRLPDEDLPRATPTRRAEFAAGRHAARIAMQAIGLPAVAIPHGPDRAPDWPRGVIGSITHTATACLAVVRRVGPLRGIGIDLEPAAPLDPALWNTILLPQEQDAVMRLLPGDRGLAVLRIFCAKEAAFKAHYPLTRALVGFEVMNVVLTDQTFTGTFQIDVPPLAKGCRMTGHCVPAGRHILALALL